MTLLFTYKIIIKHIPSTINVIHVLKLLKSLYSNGLLPVNANIPSIINTIKILVFLPITDIKTLM